MSSIYDVNEIRAWDDYTLKHAGISSLNLMERAAEACVKRIIGHHIFESVTIICGKGNNGGDGLAIARLLANSGKKVRVITCEYSKTGSKDYEKNRKRLPKSIRIESINDAAGLIFSDDILIDALFGIGLKRPIDGWLGDVVELMNEAQRPIISIDIPSGLYASDNRGNIGKIICATHTLTFQQLKMAFFYGEYYKYTGKIAVLDIGLSTEYQGETEVTLVDSSHCFLFPIDPFTHKGKNGYLTVIAGNETMLGAAILAAKSAFKTGCGYVGLISPEKIILPLAIHLPEAIWQGNDWKNISPKTSSILIGPGLGKSEVSIRLVESALKSGHRLVIDADALNIISDKQGDWNDLLKGAILTPHLLELERLIGKSNSPEERLERQKEFSRKHGLYIIQKGAYSKLSTPEGHVFINSTGNAGMATAGMGDALAGIIGSFLAQGYSAQEAAIRGMYYHGLAGDIAAIKRGIHGLLTSDLIDAIPEALNAI